MASRCPHGIFQKGQEALISYFPKGTGRPLFLLPGWGFDPLVFDLKRLDYDILIPQKPVLSGDTWLKEIRKGFGLERISILGWSLGAVVALKMVEQNPGFFDKTVLVSLGAFFSRDVISKKVYEVRKDKERALKSFYLYLFKGHMNAYKRFKREHERRVMSFWTKDELIRGLFLLEKGLGSTLEIERLLLIHGKADEICPLERLPQLSKGLNQELRILPCGHLPFLEDSFYEAVNNF